MDRTLVIALIISLPYMVALSQSVSDIYPINDVSSCNFYALIPIEGENLDDTEAYYTSPAGGGIRYLPGDTIYESSILYAFIETSDMTDEECFYVQIYDDINLGNDTTVIACDKHILPPLFKNTDVLAGYYTEPNGLGQFYSPGSLITSSIQLYAWISTDNCTAQRSYEIVIGKSTRITTVRDTFCPYLAIDYDFIVRVAENLSPDSIWVTNSSAEVFGLSDTLTVSDHYTVYSEVEGCITGQEFEIEILSDIPAGHIDDMIVCGDSILLPDTEIPNVRRSFSIRDGQTYRISNPYQHNRVPAFGEFQFYAEDRLNRCTETIDFKVNFLKKPESTVPLYQQICSGHVYPLLIMRTHPDIDFVVDEVVSAGENPSVSNGQFDTRNIAAGLYDFYLISYADPACEPAADTTLMTLEVLDNCTLPDTALIRCSNYIVARYFPEILGGSLYNDNFEVTSDLTGFFEYIEDGDLEVNGSNHVYHIIEDQFGISDTAEITIDLIDSSFELGLSSQSLCYGECIEVVASVDREDALFMNVRGLNQRPFLRVLYLGESPKGHLLSLCFDPEKAAIESEHSIESDTIFLGVADTTYEIQIDMTARECLYSQAFLSFETKGLPVQNISPLICEGETFTIAGQDFDANHSSDQIVLPGMAHDGCDSIINVDVQFDSNSVLLLNNVYNIEDTVYVNCNPYYLGNETDTLFIDRGPAQCDSIIYVNFRFEIRELDVDIIVDELSCTGDIILRAYPDTATTYQWFRDSIPIENADSSILIIDLNSTNKEGLYSVFAAMDSIEGISEEVNIELPVIHVFDTLDLCHNTQFIFGDTLIIMAGDYIQTFDHNSCDSVVQLNVNYYEEFKTSDSVELCQGNVYDWNGLEITESGMYFDTMQNQMGCDSILELSVSVEGMPTDVRYEEICEGDFYILSGDTAFTEGVYEEMIPSTTDGCDTLRTIYLDVISLPLGDTLNVEIVEGELFEYLGMEFSEEGIFTYTTTSPQGCDTLHFIDISFSNATGSIEFFVPNIFTPNGDGIHDEFRIQLANPEQTTIEEFIIYNRWGNLVWSYLPAVLTYWDGKLGNKDAVQDVYVAKIRLGRPDGTIVTYYRDLTLVR